MTDTKESMTAKICSFARAFHSNYEKNKIFDDYLAYDIMGKEEYEEIGALISNNYDATKIENHHFFNSENVKKFLNKHIITIPLTRIRYAEDKLLEFANKHGVCQYVICGAGVDTFSFRNTNKNNKGVGFKTDKRVDYSGAAHVNKTTGVKVETPHVQENGNVRPAIPGKDMPHN